MRRVPFACSAPSAAGSALVAVGMPSISSGASASRSDHRRMPLPAFRPASSTRTDPIRQMRSSSTVNPAAAHASGSSPTINRSIVGFTSPTLAGRGGSGTSRPLGSSEPAVPSTDPGSRAKGRPTMLRRPSRTRRRQLVLATIVGFGAVGALTVATAVPAGACGGLVGENGTIELVRTTTLAAYHDGVERYVTSFEFTGEGEEVGSIVPLPDVPTDVERGGDWTLQRLTAGGRTTSARRTGSCGRRRRRRRQMSTSSSRPRSTPSTSPSSRAAATRWGSGPSRTASCSPPTRRRCSTSTRRGAPSSWPRSSTPAVRPNSASRPGRARRSW